MSDNVLIREVVHSRHSRASDITTCGLLFREHESMWYWVDPERLVGVWTLEETDCMACIARRGNEGS